MGLMGRTACEVVSEGSTSVKSRRTKSEEREWTYALSSIGESLLMSLLTLTADWIGFVDGKVF